MMLVVENFKLMFCLMPKVACTSWKSVLASLHKVNQYTFRNSSDLGQRYHTSHFLKQAGVLPLSGYNLTEREHILATYTKVIAVRDPIQRLLSGYRDKFLELINPSGTLTFSLPYMTEISVVIRQ